MESEKYFQSRMTTVGRIFAAQANGCVVKVVFDENETDGFIEKETTLIRDAFVQIDEYLRGRRKLFNSPIKPEGTVFESKVWNAVMDIPYGETRTYKQIAILIGKPQAARAVGMANGKNRHLIVVPCHRVLASDGCLTGYAGGLDAKKKLLEIERNNK